MGNAERVSQKKKISQSHRVFRVGGGGGKRVGNAKRCEEGGEGRNGKKVRERSFWGEGGRLM